MRTVFKNTHLAAILSTAILLPSCSDDTMPDPAPGITLTSSAASTTLWNTVTLTATATDGQDIDKIEIRIDDASVGTATTSPYEVSWNTQKVTDGPHTATAILTDKTGLEKTAELKVTVQNTLLEAQIPTTMLLTQADWGYDERGFIFLSDDQGKVIIAQEFKNGDAISLKVPAFEGGEFSVTQVVTTPWHPSYTEASIITHTRVNRGKWVVAAPIQQKRAGMATISFTNIDANLNYLLTTNDLITSSLYQNPMRMSLEASPGLLYVTSQPKDGSGIRKYHVFPSIMTGINPTALDLALVDKPLTEETITLPQAQPSGTILLAGFHTANGAGQIYHIDLFSSDPQGKLTIQYPGEGFDSYHSVTRLRGPEYSFLNYSHKPYDIVPLAGTLSVSRNGGKITAAATGAMDIIHFDLYQNNLEWTIFADKNTTSLVIPELPPILNDVVNLRIDVAKTGMTINGDDYPQIQDYKGFLDFIRASSNGHLELSSTYVDWKSLYKNLDNTSGGRQAGREAYTSHARSRARYTR